MLQSELLALEDCVEEIIRRTQIFNNRELILWADLTRVFLEKLSAGWGREFEEIESEQGLSFSTFQDAEMKQITEGS